MVRWLVNNELETVRKEAVVFEFDYPGTDQKGRGKCTLLVIKFGYLTTFYDTFSLKNSVESESNRMEYWSNLKSSNDAVTLYSE
jgi:hypothetical protein